MKRGVSLPNVGDPGELIDLAADLEAAGWDGFFVWDHVQIVAGAGFEVHDPWMILAGAARVTEQLALGTMVSPPSRRRPWSLAKQIVTLDHLSHGRAVVGIGLGFPDHDEFEVFGDDPDLRVRADQTDEALAIIDRVLRGETVDHSGAHYDIHAHLLPRAVQSPRPRIWIAATPPHRRPLERAFRYDGVYLNLRLDTFEPLRPDELRGYVGPRFDDADFDVVTFRHPAHTPDQYADAGTTWLMETTFPGPDWLAGFRDNVLG